MAHEAYFSIVRSSSDCGWGSRHFGGLPGTQPESSIEVCRRLSYNLICGRANGPCKCREFLIFMPFVNISGLFRTLQKPDLLALLLLLLFCEITHPFQFYFSIFTLFTDFSPLVDYKEPLIAQVDGKTNDDDDNDGIKDFHEDENTNQRLDILEAKDTDGDGIPDYLDDDDDNDGIPDSEDDDDDGD
ncbi:unnamed protein product, partial [Protopolystoma xenopodis]